MPSSSRAGRLLISENRVVPLLDGRRTVEEIGREVEDVFALSDLEAGLELLAARGVLEDGNGETPGDGRLYPGLPRNSICFMRSG